MSEIKVPDGYKQTEVGVIPEDWDSIKVQDVCDFIVPGRNKPQKFDGDIPWITTPDLIDGRAVFFSRSGLKISKEVAKTVGSKIVPAGSVIMSCVGELGLVAIAGVNIVINQQLHAFLPSKKIDNYFLMYALKDQESYFHGAATKTALPYLNKDNCNATPLPLPSIQEQTAIATALSDVDNLIQSLEKLIAKKEAIKTGTMQQLLTGKTRLPEFATHEDGSAKGFKQTELGRIPEDWDLVSVDACSSKVGSGKTPTGGSSVYVTSGRPFIRSQNVGWGELKLSDVAYITNEVHQTFLGSEIESSDVLLNITGASIGRCTKADARIAGGNVNQHVCIVRTNQNKLNPKILVELINSDIGQKQIDSYQAGGNREGLNFKQVRQLKFAISDDINEQTAIATILSDMDNEIQALQKRLDKTRDIKQGMMQQLLTGKVRLAH